MKNIKLSIKFIAAVLLLAFSAAMLSGVSGLPFLGVAVALLAFSFVPRPKGVFNTALLLTQAFESEITKALFPDNAYYKRSKDDSMWVNNSQVNLPQKGASPTLTTDRSSFPGTVAQRTDTATSYLMHEFSIDPIQLQYSEALAVSYDKRASITYDIIETFNTGVADFTVIQWAPTAAVGATNSVLTTGASGSGLPPSGTGTRAQVTKADLIAIRTKMDKMNVPNQGRCALITADMYSDILNIIDFTDAQKFGTPGLPSGVITRILDFDIYVRSRAVVYNGGVSATVTDYVKSAYGAAGGAHDSEASIFWHPDFVRRAEGGVAMFIRMADPLYYGDVMSGAVRYGAAQSRSDQAGICALIQQCLS